MLSLVLKSKIVVDTSIKRDRSKICVKQLILTKVTPLKYS